jgi:hypothetical protein
VKRISYYFSTHGCSLFFSGCAGVLEDVAAAAASLWRALMSKKLAMLLSSADVVFAGLYLASVVNSCSIDGQTLAEFGRVDAKHFSSIGKSQPTSLLGSKTAPDGLCVHIHDDNHAAYRSTQTIVLLIAFLLIALRLSCKSRPPTPTTRHE